MREHALAENGVSFHGGCVLIDHEVLVFTHVDSSLASCLLPLVTIGPFTIESRRKTAARFRGPRLNRSNVTQRLISPCEQQRGRTLHPIVAGWKRLLPANSFS